MKDNYLESIKSEIINENAKVVAKNYQTNNVKLTMNYNIGKELAEAGKHYGEGYAFIGREYKLNIGDKKNYIDYLFYNVSDNKYCVVEIKSREYRKTDYGQIKTYMNYVDEHLKTVTQNNTIGIIITKSVNKFEAYYVKDNQVTIVEFKINTAVQVS